MAFEMDWTFLRAALPDLQEYILSNDLYWPLRLPARAPGSIHIPQLTIGNLLLSQARLSALSAQEMPAQRTELAQLEKQIAQLRQQWRSNWSRKAGREFSSRLNLWQQYLRELRGDPRGHAAFYTNEARHRAILRLLTGEVLEGIPQHEQEQLDLLDGILRGLGQPGPFLWEAEAASAFPEQDFWFLYWSVRK